MKDAARARLGDARWASSEHTLNLTQPEKRRRLAVLLEQRRRRRRLGHDLLFDAGRPPPRHAEEDERREEVEAEAEGDGAKMPALLRPATASLAQPRVGVRRAIRRNKCGLWSCQCATRTGARDATKR